MAAHGANSIKPSRSSLPPAPGVIHSCRALLLSVSTLSFHYNTIRASALEATTSSFVAIAGQFNHPQSGDFGARYDAAAAPYFGTMAVSSGPAFATAADFSGDGSDSGYQTRWAELLNLGWKVSPAADQDNHQNTWGAATSEYTVIVRPKGTTLNAHNVIRGLSEHMTYATEDANMQISFTANGWSMGQTIKVR